MFYALAKTTVIGSYFTMNKPPHFFINNLAQLVLLTTVTLGLRLSVTGRFAKSTGPWYTRLNPIAL